MLKRTAICGGSLLALVVLAIGCKPPVSEDMLDARQQLVLVEEPADPQTALDLMEQEGGFSEGEVVLVGSVGGIPNPYKDVESDFPWRKGQASFFLVDPATAASFEGHEHAAGEDHSDCVFCQKRAADAAASVAAVVFSNDVGDTLPYDARQLFDLKEKDTVVVRGHAQRLGEGLLVVNATGIYVRK